MSDKHTPEPCWFCRSETIIAGWTHGESHGQMVSCSNPECMAAGPRALTAPAAVAAWDDLASSAPPASSARRIVSCVNACSEINPEAVPDMLEALSRCVAALMATRTESDALEFARAVLAKATEVSP